MSPLTDSTISASSGASPTPMPAVWAITTGASMCAACVAAPDQPVAQGRPGHLAVQDEVEALLGGEAHLGRDDQRRRVEQRHVADVDPPAHFSRSAAVISAWATSATLRPWAIAVRRSAA